MNNRKRPVLFLSLIVLLLTLHPFYGFTGSRSSGYEEKLLGQINKYRKANGLHDLIADESLARLAKRHCAHMKKENTLSHEHFNERFRQSGRFLCVENVGWNYETPEDQFTAWKTSAEHNKNLLDNKITRAGIARAGAFVTFFACTAEE
jgi:uncharacterized protein YkwD